MWVWRETLCVKCPKQIGKNAIIWMIDKEA